MVDYNILFDPSMDVGARVQQGFEQGRERRYRNVLGGALENRDYDAARSAAYEFGDFETGQGIDQMVAGQAESQRASEQARQEQYRQAMEVAAPYIERAFQSEDPQGTLLLATSYVANMFPDIAREIKEEGASIAEMYEQDPDQARALFSKSQGADVNDRQQTFQDGAGNIYEVRTNPRDRNAPPAYVPLTPGAPETPQGNLSRVPSGDNPLDAIPGILDASARGDIYEAEAEGARATRAAAQTILDDISDLRGALEETGEGSTGYISGLRRAAQGATSQLDALASYGGFGAQAAGRVRRAMQDPEMSDEAREFLFMDPNLSAVDFLINSLVYSIARANDPGGRLSESDVRSVRNAFGVSGFGSDEQLLAVLDLVERRQTRSFERSQARLNELMGESSVSQPQPQSAPPQRGQNSPSDNQIIDYRDL